MRLPCSANHWTTVKNTDRLKGLLFGKGVGGDGAGGSSPDDGDSADRHLEDGKAEMSR